MPRLPELVSGEAFMNGKIVIRKNRRRLAATGDFENWGPLWIEIRTYFKDNFYSEPAQKPDDGGIVASEEDSDGNPDDNMNDRRRKANLG